MARFQEKERDRDRKNTEAGEIGTVTADVKSRGQPGFRGWEESPHISVGRGSFVICSGQRYREGCSTVSRVCGQPPILTETYFYITS